MATDRNGKQIAVGTKVRLTADATYYGGQSIPDWVKSDVWIVKSVSGDRVVLGANPSGTRDINSPVNATHLTVEGTAPVSPAAPTPKPAGTGIGDMQISEAGVNLIAKYEGCRLDAYKCPAGVWTIGYGHTAGVVQGQHLESEAKAKELLRTDLVKYGASVNNLRKNGTITFALTQNQFDSLTSFCYNCGAGNLKNLVSGRNAAQVAESMLKYNKGGGKVLPGLVRRREEERALFLK